MYIIIFICNIYSINIVYIPVDIHINYILKYVISRYIEHNIYIIFLGFIWSPSYDKFQLIYKSIQSYKSLYGHVNIPKHFIVPISDYYPEETWGLKLGLKLNNYRYRGDYNEYTQELEDIGISKEKVGINHNIYICIHI